MSIIFTEVNTFVRTEETLSAVVSHLREWGCCVRCILRFIGVRDADVFRMNYTGSLCEWLKLASAPKNIKGVSSISGSEAGIDLAVINGVVSESQSYNVTESCKMDSKVTDDKYSETSPSSVKQTVCVTCLGILQERYCSSEFIDSIARAVYEQEYEYDSFLCSVSVPVCMMLREYGTFLGLCHLMPSIFSDVHRDSITPVKDVWKWVNGPRLASSLKSPFDQKSPFEVIISFTYEQNDDECRFLYRLQPSIFRKRKKNQKQLLNADVFNRANVARAINESSREAFRCAYKCPPTRPSAAVTVTPVMCQHAAVYIAGRYNKFSRELSQTPWLIDGERKSESSVEEHICRPLNNLVLASEWRFSASGREDVDVRMLGSGRPFVVELINPRRVKFTVQEMRAVQDTINGSTSDVAVRDLQVVSKDATSVLKHGEEDKQKCYVAVCWSRDDITDGKLSRLAAIRDLTLHQKTPIRVLHRRPLATRERTIHGLSARLLSADDRHHFLLFLKTQAGTYIKEFVHSDFGRTTPSLGELLNTECDILQLDVLAVELNWPPTLDEPASVPVANASCDNFGSQ